MTLDHFHVCTLIFSLLHSTHSCFFLARFIFSCRLFYSVVCVAAVICFGCACQPCCVVLWELEPASIVSISSSLSLLFPRPTIPWNPPGTPRHSLGSVLTLFSHSQELVVNTAGSYCVCGVPTASRAVTNSTRTSSLAGSPWGASLPRNTRSALLSAMLPDVSSFARAVSFWRYFKELKC